MVVIDTTVGSLVPKVLALAGPSIVQSILSNCYAMNDFLFVSRIADTKLASACTSAISATVGMQIVCFAFHNVIPSGANAYSAQYSGASNAAGLLSTFRAGVYGSIFISTMVAIFGYFYIDDIAHLTNSTPEVTEQVAIYFGILILSSPAFGLLLLVDGYYKSNGDATTPLLLEVMSLILNTIGNYIFVLHYNFGIAGAAYASALSRLLPALIGGYMLLQGKLGTPLSLSISSVQDIREVSYMSKKLAKLGIFESMSEFIYGFVFTVLIRLTGDLGPAQQAGLGCGMRGLEWISFTISEGFLVAAMTCVGQNIGADLQERAMQAAWVCAGLSAAGAGALGVPFLLFPSNISAMLTEDPEIIKYCAIYLRMCGFIMAFVGFEMACYGVFIGAGKARIVFFTNATMNLIRIPITVIGMYGTSDLLVTLAWSIGFIKREKSDFTNLNAGTVTHGGNIIPLIGTFDSVCFSIAITSFLKAFVYLCMLSWRHYSNLLFRDSSLTHDDLLSAIPLEGSIPFDNSIDNSSKREKGCECLCFKLDQYESEMESDDDEETGLMLIPTVTTGWGRREKRRSLSTIEEEEHIHSASFSDNKGD